MLGVRRIKQISQKAIDNQNDAIAFNACKSHRHGEVIWADYLFVKRMSCYERNSEHLQNKEGR